MKKLLSIIFLTISLTSCSGDFSANIINPFSKDPSKEQQDFMITLANKMEINIAENIDNLLNGQKVNLKNYTLEAKLLVTDNETNAMQFIDFPKIDKNKIEKKETKEQFIYEDFFSGFAWEKDATKSGLMTYNEAVTYCNDFGQKYYGKTFYVPSPEQYKTILNDTYANIDTKIFKNLNATYWTNNPFAYNFYWSDGELVDKEKGLAYVRCVGKIY